MIAGETPVSCMRRITKVVSTAPNTIWPSTPMFQRPAANVTRTPEAASSSGTQATSVFEKPVTEPMAPLMISQ